MLPRTLRRPLPLRLLALFACFLGWPATALTAEAPSGAKIYETTCARCHGKRGQGTPRYKRPLEGDRSVAQLAALIQKTMPEDDPGSLSAADAKAVAAYVHDAFYSRLARERDRPARVELARLTVRQYRHAVADLIGSFRAPPADLRPGGLKGEYFTGRRFDRGNRVLERTDPQVAIDFGTKSPVPDKLPDHEFSIRWTGSLLAQQTGEHEFVVRTEHAARLWLNDAKRPLIDAWVRSGKDTEHRATLFLVAGRAYPLRLEYSKARQGVAKKDKTPPPPVQSSITLLWKPPQRALQPIPGRHLSPGSTPEAYVCATPFPPDDRSYGWERGTAVSREWDQATTDAALDAANHVAGRLAELSGVKEGAADREAKLRQFARTFAERAFRRPLSEEQKAVLDRQFAAGRDPEVAIKRVVLVVLKSPWFLYREVGAVPPSAAAYDVAARLSFGLWDSLPDQELLAAAGAGRLATREQVVKQAERMLADPRGRTKLREFLLTWLHADHGFDLARDAKRFPGFDGAFVSDLRTSLELFLDDVVWSDASDFRQLLLSDQLLLNGRLAKSYGADLPAGADFRKVKVDGGKRAGVLTHPYLMAGFSSDGESSPIHRGVFLARGVLGIALRPPPEAVTPLSPALHPTLTTRQRVTLQTKSPSCLTCHNVINPLGFTLEHFDAIGRFRDKDNGKPIDATGSYQPREGKMVRLDGARELAAFLAGSPEAHAAFTEAMFHHLVQQGLRAYGPDTLDRLRRSFAAGNFHVRRLAAEVMAVSALYRKDDARRRKDE